CLSTHSPWAQSVATGVEPRIQPYSFVRRERVRVRRDVRRPPLIQISLVTERNGASKGLDSQRRLSARWTIGLAANPWKSGGFTKPLAKHGVTPAEHRECSPRTATHGHEWKPT